MNSISSSAAMRLVPRIRGPSALTHGLAISRFSQEQTLVARLAKAHCFLFAHGRVTRRLWEAVNRIVSFAKSWRRE
jgi:hypothetical protein